MTRATLAEIAGVRVFNDQFDQPLAAEFLRQRPCVGLVAPHQRRMQFERTRHAEVERDIQRLDGVVAAVGIAGEIRLAHPADNVGDAPPVSQRGCEGQEHQIAARHEGIGQAPLAHFNRRIAC